jgi:hypothetical protein
MSGTVIETCKFPSKRGNLMDEKKEWHAPVLTIYGDVQELTQQVKSKQPGSRDDFGVTGISDP